MSLLKRVVGKYPIEEELLTDLVRDTTPVFERADVLATRHITQAGDVVKQLLLIHHIPSVLSSIAFVNFLFLLEVSNNPCLICSFSDDILRFSNKIFGCCCRHY